jgi:hypothetical protein
MFGVHAGATAIPYAAARGAEVMYRPPVVMTTESSRALAISDDQPTLCCHGCRVQVLLDDSEVRTILLDNSNLGHYLVSPAAKFPF